MIKKITLALITLFALLLNLSFSLCENFAEFYTMKIAPIFRISLSLITSPLPFSLGESIILILVFLIVILIISGLKLILFKILGKSTHSLFKPLSKVLFYSLFSIFVLYNIAFSSSYSRRPINVNIGLDIIEPDEEKTAAALEAVALELNKLEHQIKLTEASGTVSGTSFEEIFESVAESADKASEKYPIYQKYLSKAKPIALGEPLAYTGISGVYTFFTGESNINTVFPEYTLPFTLAHEYSHQLGIGAEKEAEFSAFLICLESDNPYIRYSAYSQAAITLSNTLFKENESRTYKILRTMPDCFLEDAYLSSEASKKYTSTHADEIAQTVNNAYLLASGDSGIKSYSLSSKLYISYLLRSGS